MSPLQKLRLLLLPALISGTATGADAARYDSARLTLALTPRTPQQMAAFYEARGFNREMIDILSEQCFITVFIDNKSQDIVWLDLANWRFANDDGVIDRLDRTYWRRHWQAMRIPPAHQSTFRWTLLPEQLDFRPGEHEGGNIILPRLGKPMTITARFDIGADRSGTPILVEFDKIQCAENP